MLKHQVKIYKPSVNIHGFFIDRNPFLEEKEDNSTAIICPCGSRKKTGFENMTQFKKHLQSQTHKKWIETMNLEKKIQQLETELYAIAGGQSHQCIHEKEELWYGQIFPDHKDVIPKEDLWSENDNQDFQCITPETFEYNDMFPQEMDIIPSLSEVS